MSNEQLREALRETLLFCETFSNRWDGETGAHPFDMVERARQALATTEPEPTGMPELPPISTWTTPVGKIKAYTADNVQAYGEQCWKAGYKHGAWDGDARDAERYRWLADCNNYAEAARLISDGSLTEDALGKAIDAAMAKGVKG